ncbi:MAG TPA: protein-glutamate O-methyltransferase CheR [Vicinamibacterales bacterium]|nr:protein-glutamate O-methyltransferase CheR [Vicinamibacterales bacterium]
MVQEAEKSDAVTFFGFNRPRMSRLDMERITRLVYANTGIALRPELKEAMVVARLQRRLREGGFSTFTDYLRAVESDRSGKEMRSLLEALTTNHTGFFREPQHFDILSKTVVPPLVVAGPSKPIRAWSAACATGEEAYSIAITLLERVPAVQHDRIRLMASDLCTEALETARAGVYPVARVAPVEPGLLRAYFERGIGHEAGLARVKRSVRDLIDFRRVNLMQLDRMTEAFDFIFCRNVMMYFDIPARQRVVTVLERLIAPNGYLFVSHSESLSGLKHGFQWCFGGVYQRGLA